MPHPVIRTPESAFEDLVDYPFNPNYIELLGYRIHYVDEGDKDNPIVLLLHGEPSWSYLYRNMIPPLVEEGYRVIAPDLLGFGKSDKLIKRSDYSYQLLVDIYTRFIEKLDLTVSTLFIQDWGALIGLRLLETVGDNIERVLLSNGAFPAASGIKGFMGHFLFKLRVKLNRKVSQENLLEHADFVNWASYSQTVDVFPTGQIIQGATRHDLTEEEVYAYDAPFPEERYKEGARQLPMLVTSQLRKNHEVWEKAIKKWEKPFLTVFGDSDPITRGAEQKFIHKVPGAERLDHKILKNAGHFIQEDRPQELVENIIELIETT